MKKCVILLEFYYKTERCRPLPTICIIKLELKRVRPGTDPVKSGRLLASGLGCNQTEFGFPLICKKNEGKAKQATRRKLTPSHLPCKVGLNSEVNGEKIFDKRRYKVPFSSRRRRAGIQPAPANKRKVGRKYLSGPWMQLLLCSPCAGVWQQAARLRSL